jgi:hypothetical protein
MKERILPRSIVCVLPIGWCEIEEAGPPQGASVIPGAREEVKKSKGFSGRIVV